MLKARIPAPVAKRPTAVRLAQRHTGSRRERPALLAWHACHPKFAGRAGLDQRGQSVLVDGFTRARYNSGVWARHCRQSALN